MYMERLRLLQPTDLCMPKLLSVHSSGAGLLVVSVESSQTSFWPEYNRQGFLPLSFSRECVGPSDWIKQCSKLLHHSLLCERGYPRFLHRPFRENANLSRRMRKCSSLLPNRKKYRISVLLFTGNCAARCIRRMRWIYSPLHKQCFKWR